MREDLTLLQSPGSTEYEGEAAVTRVPVRMMWFCWRNRHATIPLSMPFCLITAAEAMQHHPEPLWAETSVAALVTVTVWNTAAKKWSITPRIKGLRWSSEVGYARATVVAGTAWLLFAARYGPLTPVLEWLLALGCAAWGIPFWWHKRPRGKRARKRHAAQVARWDCWWQSHAHAWGAGGSAIVDIVTGESVDSLLIQLVKGRQSLDTIKGQARLIESALDGHVAHGMTRFERNKARPSQVWLHLKRENPLREVIPFSEDMLPTDITREAPLGVRESGAWLTAVMRKSTFIIGATRSGKSNEESVMFATITGCRNARLWLIDMKGGRSMRPWLAAVDWPAVTMTEAQIMLACAVAETKARATYATSGDEQLQPTNEVPAIFTAIDETYEVTSEAAGRPGKVCATELARLSSQGAGVEMYALITTQYGSLEDSVQTEQTRMNLRRRMCFQVEHPDHGTFALGEDSRNGSADPTKLEEPGTFYYRSDAKTTLEQIRGPEIPHRLVREIAARNAGRTGLHESRLLLYCGNFPSTIPGKTWQQVYDERWSRLPAAFHADAPQGVTLTPSPEAPESAVPTRTGNAQDPEVVAELARINDEVDELPVTVADIARARALRVARGAPDFDLAGDFGQAKRRFAILLQGASQERPATPVTLRRASGTSESWVHLTLGRLAESGQVIKAGRGQYYPVAGADILAALDVIEAEEDRLAKAADELVGANEP